MTLEREPDALNIISVAISKLTSKTARWAYLEKLRLNIVAMQKALREDIRRTESGR